MSMDDSGRPDMRPPDTDRSDTKRERAKVVYFVAPGKIEVRSEAVVRERPELIRVESKLMAVSHGTEMLAYRGEMPRGIVADETISALSGEVSYPMKYGYSNVGTGPDGDLVFAFAPHQDLFHAAEEDLIRIPEGISPEDAVFIPNMETAVSIVHDTAARPGEVILVTGLGVVGLLVAAFLRTSHYGPIVGVEPYDLRREAAERFGIRSFAPGDTELGRTVEELTRGRGADRAIDVSGTESGMRTALGYLGYESTLVAASWFGEKRVGLDLGRGFHRNRITIRSSQVSTIDPSLRGRWDKKRRMDLVLDLLGELRPRNLITHIFSLEEAAKAFELIDSKPDECIQVVLTP